MALGHALLHPERVRRALDADASADAFGASVDAGLGLFGFGDPGPAATAWAEGLAARAQPLADRMAEIGKQGPFALFTTPPAPDIDGLTSQLGALLDALATLDADGLRLRLSGMLDLVLGALPDLRLPGIAGFVNGEIDAALGILESPLLGGRRDPAAHRAFRTAAEIRRRLRPLADALPPAFASLDLKLVLRARLMAQLDGLDTAALAALGAKIGELKGEFGTLFSALGRVSVRVEVSAGGPSPMADRVPVAADESKVTPFPRGHGMWWLDLVTGVVSFFNLIWEMARTRNFNGRGFDGFMSVLLMLWQGVRVGMRAGMPDAMAEWPSGSQWLFTDQGDFVLSVGLRFLAAFHEVGSETNWVGSVLVRALKHIAAVSHPRMVYQFGRSLWYLGAWKNEATKPLIPFLRLVWAAWGPMWISAHVGGLFPSWEDFRLEGLERSVIGPLVGFGLVSLVPACALLFGEFRGAEAAVDHASMGVMLGVLLLVVVLVGVLLEGLESDSRESAIGALIGVSIAVLLAILVAWIPKVSRGGIYVFILLVGLFVAYMVPFVLWWDFIDDGRDKPGAFDNLNADSSPYRLPYTEGENWMCSQGTHGIFSHHTLKSTTNHYAYDFNEVEYSVVRAARSGVVVELDEGHENRKQEPNFLHVLHTHWVEGHDPGTDDERVLTFANYFHLTERGVLPALGQPVQRGEDIARLDSTGRSAQQHIHIAVEEQQRGSAQGLPFVFGDDDTKGFRQYPLLAWIPGKGAIPGKPISYAFYTSANTAPTEATAAAQQELALGMGGSDNHVHGLVITAAAQAGAADPVEAFTQPARGHVHRVLISRAALATLRGTASWTDAGITVDPAPDGHTHQPLRDALRRLTVVLDDGISATAGTHKHDLTVDLRDFTAGVPDPVMLTSGNMRDNRGAATPPPASHTHPVTVTRATIDALLHRTPLPAGGIAVATADGHTHTTSLTYPLSGALSLPSLSAGLVAPPRARIVATQPGPHPLWGDQFVLRLNDRMSEAWLFGAHRPQLAPDVPAERGLAAAEALTVGGTTVTPGTDTRGSPRLAAAALTRALRATGGRERFAALVPTPVIVLETRTRGSAARLRHTGGAALFGAGGPEIRGVGDLPDLGAIPRADLAAHIAAFLQAGWPAPPPGIANAFLPGGPPLDVAAGAPRNAAVLARAAAPADGAIATTAPLPLQPGRVGVSAGWHAPLLATPSVLRLDLTHPAMAVGQRSTLPLNLIVAGTAQPVSFDPADTSAEAVARRIMLQADGIRARADGTNAVLITTVAGGSTVALSCTKDPGLSLSAPAGASAPFAGGPITDSGAVPPAVLRAAVADAAARAVLPYTAATVAPVATIEGDRIRLAVAAGHTIRRTGEGLPLLPGSAPAGVQWDSDALPATLSLAGSSWLDIEVDGATVRVPLTGEPARLELGPLPRLPLPGETLELEVGGSPVTIPFDGTEGSVAGVAARIAEAVAGATVRFAWSLAAAGTLHGARSGPAPLTLADSTALSVLGFLRARATLTDSATGPLGDALQAGPGGPIDGGGPDIAWRVRGATSPRLSVPDGAPLRLAAQPGDTLTVAVTGADPLALLAGATHEASVTAALPAALVGDVATYDFTATLGGSDIARATAQLAALPAALRGFATPLATGPVRLTVTVTAPDGPRPAVTVDLAGFADAEEAAGRLAAVPGVVAFPVALGAITAVQVETQGKGTGWSLRLAGRDALQALGFARPGFDTAAEALDATGGGTVRDGAAVTEAEARAMLARAAAAAVLPAPTPPPLFAVAAAGGGLDLAPGAAGAPLPTLATEPADYLATLNAAPAAGVLHLAPGGTTAPHSALLRVTAGTQRTSVALIGAPALLRAPDPMPAEASPEAATQRAYLQTTGVSIRIDGTTFTVPPSPTPFATLDDAVEWIAAAIAPAWAGLVPDPAVATARHLVIRSARRGTNAGVRFTPPPGAPAGLLGFRAETASAGSGTVENGETLTVAGSGTTLETLLRNRADRPDVAQTLFRAVADDAAGTVRLVPVLTGTTLAPPTGLPAAVQTQGVGGTALLSTGAAVALDQGLVRIDVREPGGDPAVVLAPLWTTPARLAPLVPPAPLTVLATRTLDFVLDGAAITVTFGPVTSLAGAAAQIARATGWRLRAFPQAGALVVESLREGNAVRLDLIGGTALTDNPATGFTAPARPLNAAGAGTLPDIAAATPTAMAAALEAGWREAGAVLDDLDLATQRIDRRAYGPAARNGDGWILGSQRPGIAGRVERLAVLDLPGGPAWEESLGRGAALHAAIALPPIDSVVSPVGALRIRLDDNAGPGLPTPREVQVDFDGTALTAAALAARIDAVLRPLRAGAAAAWPDGTVVIETAQPGLAGSIAVPAPGTRGAADMLVGNGVTLAARGWPGSGRADPFAAMAQGWRAVRPTAAMPITYEFRADGRSTGPIAITAGMDAAAAAIALNTGFDGTATGGAQRIGLAAVVDGALCIEAVVAPMSLLFGAALQEPTTPDRAGETPEWPTDPAFGLRRTDMLRTLRLVRAATDDAAFAGADDLGWLRHPTSRVAPPPADPALTPSAFPPFPVGRWLAAVRPDAAQAADAPDIAALRAATAMAPLIRPHDARHVAPLMLRYWVRLDAQDGQLGGSTAGPEPFMVDTLRWT
jgi:hypothetical protein